MDIDMKKLFFYLSIFALPLWGCSNNSADDEPPTGGDEPVEEIQFSEEDAAIAAQMQGFNMDFFKAAIAINQPDGNVVVSPLSAQILLSMFANAADETIAAQISDALGYGNVAELNELCSKYLKGLPAIDKTTVMSFANSLWYQQGYKLNPTFNDVLANYYDSDVFGRPLLSGAPSIVEEINGWVSKKTENMIPRIIEKLNNNVEAILINALYFKGEWANPFEQEETTKKEFNGIDGKSWVDMMHKLGLQHYCETETFQAVKMEFGNKSYEAIFVLPNAETTIDQFISSGALSELDKLRYNDDFIDFSFPKFKIEPELFEINDALTMLGISPLDELRDYDIFTPSRSAMCRVWHGATIEFNEKGAEGAGVTFAGMVSGGPGEPKIPVVNFDRPFMFFVRETTTGAMVFAGKIMKL